MVKSEVIVRHVNEDESDRAASNCPWHAQRNCFLMFHKTDPSKNRYHCLFSNSSKQWHPYGASGSCDLPEEMHDMRILKSELLGEEYALPFRYCFRERSGYTVGAFDLRPNLHGPEAITPANLSEMFYAAVVVLCAVCRRLGGSAPKLKLSSLLYTPNHPLLSGVGEANSEKRSRVGNREKFSGRSWNRFIREKTCADVLGYMQRTRPELFRAKCRKGGKCRLRDTEKFDDETHRLICENKKSKIANVLVGFAHLARGERLKKVVASWIRENETAAAAAAATATTTINITTGTLAATINPNYIP